MTPAVRIASDLVRIPSVNPMGEAPARGGPQESSGLQESGGRAVQGASAPAESALGDYLEGFFRDKNIPVLRQQVSPGRDNIVAHLEAPGSRRTVLLDAHQDTVPAGGMTIAPFGGVVREAKLWGRGACDVKGGMAAMLAAVERIAAERPRGAASVVLACTVDEEHTFRGARRLLAGPWPGGRPDMAIVAEPTGMEVVIAHKGLVRWKIATRGKSCHSANPELGNNAIYGMARVLSVLELYADTLAGGASHSLLGHATLSVGTIGGGTSVNTVPSFCEVEVDRRLIPGEDPGKALDDCREEILSVLGHDFPAGFEQPWLAEPALDTPIGSEVARIALEAVASVLGSARPRGVPYGTDASTLSSGGIPSIVLGPGNIAQAHTEDEWIETGEIDRAVEVYYNLIRIAGR